MGLDASVYRDVDEEERLAHIRIGNVATVGALSASIAPLLPADSVVLAKVLYSGSHCGDRIEPELFDQLRCELERIQSTDPYVDEFALALLGLIKVAEGAGMAIVF